MTTIADHHKGLLGEGMILSNGRFSTVFKRWEKVIDYLVTKEWVGADAYQYAYPRANRTTSYTNFRKLMADQRFRDLMKYLMITKYGVSEERVVSFWNSKIDGADKEENAMRASENLAKFLQVPGFSKEDEKAPNVQVFVGFKNE